MYGSLTYLPPSNFAVFDGLQRAENAQITQLNQLFQLLHLVHIYGHGFYDRGTQRRFLPNYFENTF